MPWWWIPAMIVAISVVNLTGKSISTWFTNNKQIDTSYGEIVRKKLGEGKYKVVTNVFKTNGNKTASHIWEADELDSELDSKFRNRNVIRVDI